MRGRGGPPTRRGGIGGRLHDALQLTLELVVHVDADTRETYVELTLQVRLRGLALSE